jgi:hypothetical protein
MQHGQGIGRGNDNVSILKECDDAIMSHSQANCETRKVKILPTMATRTSKNHHFLLDSSGMKNYDSDEEVHIEIMIATEFAIRIQDNKKKLGHTYN